MVREEKNMNEILDKIGTSKNDPRKHCVLKEHFNHITSSTTK